MNGELALLQNYLLVGAVLFGVGLVGFVSRRNMIVMFIAVEMMLQGVSVSLVAWSRYRDNFDGQMLVIFMIAVAACEAAIALAMILTLFQRRGSLDVVLWRQMHEADQKPFVEDPLDLPESAKAPWPTLPVAGVEPQVAPEKTNFRPKV